MLFKLIALVVMAHQINACCLPATYQYTVLSETNNFGSRSTERVIMAADEKAGKAATISFSGYGRSHTYADLRRGIVYSTNVFGDCQQRHLDADFLAQLNRARCAQTHNLTESPIRLSLAGGVNVTLYSGQVPFGSVTGDNTTVDVTAVITDKCFPVIYKLSGSGFSSANLFGDFRAVPQPGILELPKECRRNATSSGPRKRGLGFATNAFMV